MEETFADALEAMRHCVYGNKRMLAIAQRLEDAHNREIEDAYDEGAMDVVPTGKIERPITKGLREAIGRHLKWREIMAHTMRREDFDSHMELDGDWLDAVVERMIDECDGIDAVHLALENENAELRGSA